MWSGAAIVLGVYVAVVVSIAIFQRHLLYHPVKAIAAPSVYGLTNIDEVFLIAADGVKLQAWVHNPREGYPTIVYFHGNAGHLGDRASKFSAFADAGLGLVAVSYRGYGKSKGVPSEQGLYNDARAAIAYAREAWHVPQHKLIYFGESLGTGVAIQMATEASPGLLVLEAPYTSVANRAAELYPFIIGVKQVVWDKYDSLSRIGSVHAPLLLFHGWRDPIIPLRHGRALFAVAKEPKEMVEYEEVHHTDFTNAQLLEPLLRAARTHGVMPK